MKKKLIIPLVIKSRELDSRILIAAKLLCSPDNEWEVLIGYSKKLGKYYNQKSTEPFILFEKGISYYIERYIKIINNYGRVVLLDEEGGIFCKIHDLYPRGGYKNNSIKYIEKIR